MHELLKHVLNERDLTRAGDLFALQDSDIVNDLNDVLKQITEISSRPDYVRNDRDQALIEICVTRVTSCIKETGTLEKYAGALVSLLESCLHHNLMPVGHLRDDDPPHAKIASDVIACIVLVSFPMQAATENYGNKAVMQLFLPVAVQFLHKGNREISRHMARYLSLAAVHHAELLKPHVHTIMDSIMSGNYPLCRILTNLYEVCPEPLEGHVTALVSLLPHAEQIEKNSLFSLLEQIAVRRPEALKAGVPQLISYLCPSTTGPGDPGCMCEDVLQLIACVSRSRVSLIVEQQAPLSRAATHAHLSPRARAHALAALTQVGLTDNERAQTTLQLIVEQLRLGTGGGGAGGGEQGAWLRAAAALCRKYPQLFTDKLLAALRPHAPAPPKPLSSTEVNRTSGGVTIVKLSGSGATTAPTVTPATTAVAAGPTPSGQATGYTRRAKLGDSRSTGRLHAHRSMTRLNVPGGSVGGLHKSMTRLSSSQQINAMQTNAPPVSKLSGGGAVTVTTVSRHPRHHHNILISNNTSPTIITSPTLQNHHPMLPLNPCKSTDILSLPPLPSLTNSQLSTAGLSQLSHLPEGPTTSSNLIPSPGVTVTSRRNNTSVTMINSSNNNNSTSNHRISVFEPYPMKDTVQHFCEKHLDKIKAYMDTVSLRIPPPAKCTIEERRSKKLARLQFACGRRGPHCLYARSAFSLRTRLPRVWIHLMFLALQARQTSALSSRDASVTSLKMCWDALKCENRTFLTLVTSAFPAQKEQDFIINELRLAGFFDVFEINTTAANGQRLPPTQCVWGCFLCNHPERAVGFLAGDGPPVIEGQLKEKKGRWRLFRRWRTRYFTLSGAHLSCKGSSGGESIDINQIRSVKVSRGARNIPKAFEIFTGDQTLILKPKDGKNAEEWVQCLSIAVAHSQARDVPAKANSLPARGLTLKSF